MLQTSFNSWFLLKFERNSMETETDNATQLNSNRFVTWRPALGSYWWESKEKHFSQPRLRHKSGNKATGLKKIQSLITIKKIVLHKFRLIALFGPIRSMRLDISAVFFISSCLVLAKLFIWWGRKKESHGICYSQESARFVVLVCVKSVILNLSKTNITMTTSTKF